MSKTSMKKERIRPPKISGHGLEDTVSCGGHDFGCTPIRPMTPEDIPPPEDTPRTNKALVDHLPADATEWSVEYLHLSRHARQLERELEAMRKSMHKSLQLTGRLSLKYRQATEAPNTFAMEIVRPIEEENAKLRQLLDTSDRLLFGFGLGNNSPHRLAIADVLAKKDTKG